METMGASISRPNSGAWQGHFTPAVINAGNFASSVFMKGSLKIRPLVTGAILSEPVVTGKFETYE